MKALVSLSARFCLCSDGGIYSLSPWPKYGFFKGYLEVFDEILVVARVEPTLEPPLHDNPCNGPGVSFAGLPSYRGALSFLKLVHKIRPILSRAVTDCQAFILRVPDNVGLLYLVMNEIQRRNCSFALEVIGDPWGVYQAGNVDYPLLPLVRFVATKQLRNLCSKAEAVAYVTKQFLQRQYPYKKDAFVTIQTRGSQMIAMCQRPEITINGLITWSS
jgi:hypothetical protein